MPRRKLVVVQDEEKPVETSVLAKAILDIAAASKRLSTSGLNARAVCLLLSDLSGVPITTVRLVVGSMAELETKYLTASPGKPGRLRIS